MSRSPALSAALWLRTFRSAPGAQIRLICFPPAGGTASFFRDWGRWVPDGWEVAAVCYPGREHRIDEPDAVSMADLVGQVAEALAPSMAMPTVFFGHSMGASVAHEVAVLLAGQLVAPVALFLSGRPAPDRLRPFNRTGLTDEKLLGVLGELGGISEEILRDPDLRDVIVPPIRSDYHLLEAYANESKAGAVDVPIVAYYGDGDSSVNADDIQGWERFTSADCDVAVFPGGHFYLIPGQAVVVQDIVRRVARLRGNSLHRE